MEFNKKGFTDFRNDLEVALEDVAKKHKVDIKLGRITYSDYDFSIKLEVTKNEDGIDVQKRQFEDNCRYYGFEPQDYEREFGINGKRFKLVGFNLKSPKNNCSIVGVADGKSYKCSSEVVHRAFKDE